MTDINTTLTGETTIIETPTGEVPVGEVPVGEVPVGEVPVGEVPIGEVPVGEVPVGEVPIGETPIGEVPVGFQVDNTSPSVVDSISSPQGNKEGEMFDFTQLAGQKVEATFTIKREAGYDSSVSFYKIDDAAGTVTSGGKQFRPGESGYIEAALANAISGLKLAGKNGETVTVSQTMEGGSMYAPILTSNVTSSNPSGEIYTAFSIGNTDRTDHVRLLGDNTFGFEDLYNGGDKDFNDVIVKATFKVV